MGSTVSTVSPVDFGKSFFSSAPIFAICACDSVVGKPNHSNVSARPGNGDGTFTDTQTNIVQHTADFSNVDRLIQLQLNPGPGLKVRTQVESEQGEDDQASDGDSQGQAKEPPFPLYNIKPRLHFCTTPFPTPYHQGWLTTFDLVNKSNIARLKSTAVNRLMTMLSISEMANPRMSACPNQYITAPAMNVVALESMMARSARLLPAMTLDCKLLPFLISSLMRSYVMMLASTAMPTPSTRAAKPGSVNTTCKPANVNKIRYRYATKAMSAINPANR